MRMLPFSVVLLLLSNLFLLYEGMQGHWQVSQFLLIYWCESAIIGAFTLLKLYLSRAKGGSPVKVTVGGKAQFMSGDSPNSRLFMMGFFCVHFGLFMFVHLIFLLVFLMDQLSVPVILSVLGASVILFISHAVSFLMHFYYGPERDTLSPDAIFYGPYPRVIVMHLVTIFGAILGMGIVLVVAFKIVGDLIGHYIEHGVGVRSMSLKVG